MKRWPTKPLGEVAQVTAGDPAPQRPKDFSDDGVPFVRMQDVGRFGQTVCLAQTKDRLSASASPRFKRFPAGSILVPKSGASIRLNHRAILGIEAHVVSHLAVIVPRPSLDTRFAYYWLCATDLAGVAHQADLPSMKTSDLAKLQLPVPPLAEQERIAKLLDAADELRKLRAEADRRTAKLIPALFHEMFGDPGINPKGWPQSSFAAVGKLDRGRSKNRPRDEPSLYGGKYPFIQTGDVANSNGQITAHTQTYSEKGLAQSRMWPTGTLVITIAANIGKTAVLTFPACFPDSIVGFIPGEKVLVDYVRQWLVTIEGRLEEAAPQMAQKNINLKILSELILSVPPLALQKEFGERVAEMRGLEASQVASRHRLDDLFQSMLDRAFEGRL
jgi:type I restriction enzyme S subunit